MTGRPLYSDAEAIAMGFGGAECRRRRQVLRETLAAFERSNVPGEYHRLAAGNLARWSTLRRDAPDEKVQVIAGDWGEVTLELTKRYGVCFAVLNMANADVPGGAYGEGAIAQEENMFRRTDCHFHIRAPGYVPADDCYAPEMTRLISGCDGRVYLDVQHPRVCIRGPEDRSRADLGYQWLPDDEVFPFYELRSAAQDLRGFIKFDSNEARKRIAAQLDTLHANSIRHTVLGAFGCGAFRNPARRIAELYKEEIDKRAEHFDLIAFAIFAAGYGPDNYEPFARVFRSGRP